MVTKTRATYDDLMAVEGKAEIIDGEIVALDMTGDDPNWASGEIFVALRNYARRIGRGRDHTDGIAYRVNLPHRQSFSPDVSFFTGAQTGMKFLLGAPDFAVEVRSENDYGEAAGTQVVWDVDVLGEIVVRKYTATDPEAPTEYRRGEIADAEPALPGWTMPVDALFDE